MATQRVPSVNHRPRLLNRAEVAENTMAFHFEKPLGFDFKPGQAADLTLLDPPETDAEGNTRTFSIVSASSGNELMFATRMRDTAFKHSLKKMALGTAIELSPAMGAFTLHKNPAKPGVFLAGGIGITPFSSIVRQAAHDHGPHKIYLFYSNRRPEEAAFMDTLQQLEKANPNFHLIATMTDMSRSSRKWEGETGHIDKDMLSRHLSGLQGPIYYIAGPPAMVTAMRTMLVVAGVDEDDIRSEEFAGY